MGKTVLVTGASGFLGGRVADRLLQGGYEVMPFLLPGERSRFPRPVYGDLADPSTFDVPSCDAVVHCAGLLESGHHSKEKMLKVNFEGTRNLFDKAVGKGVGRFLFISSISAVGPVGKRDAPITERTPPCPDDDYGRSKLMAEQFLSKAARDGPCSIVILRPSVLYGPGMGENTSAMRTFFAVLSRKMPMVGEGSTILNMLYVDNLVEAIVLALEKGPRFGTYNISEGPYSQKTIIDAIERRSGGRGGHIKMPRRVLWFATLFSEMASPFLKAPPPLSWTKYRALTSDGWRMDSSKITDELGFRPKVSLEEGVDRTFEHYGW